MHNGKICCKSLLPPLTVGGQTLCFQSRRDGKFVDFDCRKFSDLFKWFKDFLGYKESGMIEAIPASATGKERISGELAMEIGEYLIREC